MRQQHYQFAHSVLMNAVLRDPEGFWRAAEAQGPVILQQPWAEAGQGQSPADLVQGAPPSLTQVSPSPDVRVFLVTMPPPESATECYFIAVLRVGAAPPRYFVAERGFDGEGGAARAYWAEWKSAPGAGIMRVRGQDLPAITPEAFVAAAADECRAAAAMPPAGPPAGWQGAPGGPGGWQGGPGGPGGWQGGPGGPGGARMMPLPGAPPGKKSRVPMFIGCGCLGLFLFVVGVGGFLLYEEELRGLHVPDTEVATAPVEPGKPFSVEFTWDGTGYAFNNVWLVVEEGKKSGGSFQIKSNVTCSRGGGSERTKTISLTSYEVHDLEDKGGDTFSAWIYLDDEYAHSSAYKIRCSGTVEPLVGSWTKAHIGVTQRQRPGDFIAN